KADSSTRVVSPAPAVRTHFPVREERGPTTLARRRHRLCLPGRGVSGGRGVGLSERVVEVPGVLFVFCIGYCSDQYCDRQEAYRGNGALRSSFPPGVHHKIITSPRNRLRSRRAWVAQLGQRRRAQNPVP